MMQVNKKSCKELLAQRMFLAIVTGIAVQLLFVICLVLITNLSADYTSWVQDTWATITSFRMWSYFCILATITFFQGVICSKSYSNTPIYTSSRFKKLCGLFTSQNILLVTLHVTIGSLLIWLHLLVKGNRYSSLTTECKIVYGSCLVEEHYFLLLSGLWSGLYFFTATSTFHVRYLKFPIIPLSKFFRFKKGMYSMVSSLMIDSAWSAFYYMSSYYFLGSYCRAVILFVTSAQIETESLSSISRLFNLSLLLHLWLYQLIFILTIDSLHLLFELNLTEWTPFEFKQNNVFGNDETGVTLAEAMSMDKLPIMQHLGYLDLVSLAQKDKQRRSTLFTLSQPGGHPYNWNCIVEKCVGLIKKFSEDLSAALIKTQELSPPASNLAAIPANTFHKDYVYHMRSLVQEKSPLSAAEETDLKQSLENESFVQKFVRTKWKNFMAYLLSKPLVHYVFGEQEGTRVCYVLFNGQPVVWAADAISSLSVWSLTEDNYGIAQKDLPQIINTLLALKQALDKLQKSNILAKKQEGDDKFVKQIFTSLRVATKRSLYRIVTNFEVYLADLTLTPASMEQLQNFLNYRE